MCFRDADERFGLCFRQAFAQVGQSDAGINQDRDCSQLEEGEGKGEEVQARGNHECDAHPAPDPKARETQSQPTAGFIELSEGVVSVADLALLIPSMRKYHRRPPRLTSGHCSEVGSNVHL